MAMPLIALHISDANASGVTFNCTSQKTCKITWKILHELYQAMIAEGHQATEINELVRIPRILVETAYQVAFAAGFIKA